LNLKKKAGYIRIMKKNSKPENKQKFNYFGPTGKLVIIFFLGFSVYLLISTIMLIFLTKPTGEIKVPQVVGKNFTETYNSLIRRGLRPEIKFRDVYDIDNGIILSQYPESGHVAAEDSTLNLVVSRNDFRVDVPNLIGSNLPIAINKLKNLNSHGRSVSISSGVISYIPSEKTADNIVIGQSPRANQRIRPDQRVNFLVSSGKIKEGKRMPGITGQSIDLCYDLLAAKGLSIREEIVETWNIKNSGKVISHKPYKNQYLKGNETAVLKIYWYPMKEHPYMAYEKFEYSIPEGEKAGLYEALIEDDASKKIRFSRKMKPGQKIRFIFHRTGNARISIMRDKEVVRITGVNVEKFN